MFSPGEFVPLFAIVGPLVFVAFVVGFGILQEAHKKKLQHETIRFAIEKGQPVPMELFKAEVETVKALNDRKSGIVLISVALGVYFTMYGIGATFEATGITLGAHISNALRYIALIPGLIGVGLLINWYLDNKSPKSDLKR